MFAEEMLPRWEIVNKKVEEIGINELNPLEKFVYDNEPQTEVGLWKQSIIDMINFELTNQLAIKNEVIKAMAVKIYSKYGEAVNPLDAIKDWEATATKKLEERSGKDF